MTYPFAYWCAATAKATDRELLLLIWWGPQPLYWN